MNDVFLPLVSIVIPVYNGANYMREAIDSALAQTYENKEIIVVNDGSTDDGETERIALSYGDKIRYFKKENGGCASALNYGIQQMRGEWLSWLSHDDVYLPTKVSASLACVQKYNLSHTDTVVYCATTVIDKNGNTVRCSKRYEDELIDCEEMFTRFMEQGYALNACSLLIPKKVLDTVGSFSTTYTYILDWKYWVDIALHGFSYFRFPEYLAKNRRHNEQVSVQKNHLYMEESKRFAEELSDDARLGVTQKQSLWMYCSIMGFNTVCKDIEKKISIPMKMRVIGFYKNLRLRILNVLKAVYRLRYR